MRYVPTVGIILLHIAASASNAALPKRPASAQCPLVVRDVPEKFRRAQMSGKEKAGVLLSHAAWEPEGEWVIIDVDSWKPLTEAEKSKPVSSPPFGAAQPDLLPPYEFPIALIAIHISTQTTACLMVKNPKGPSSLICDFASFPAFHPLGRDCVAVRVGTELKSGKYDSVFWEWDLRRKTVSLLGQPRMELISLAAALEKTDYELEWPQEKVRGVLKSVTLRQRTKPNRKVVLRLPVPSAEFRESEFYPSLLRYTFLPGRRRNSIVMFDNCQSRVTLNAIGARVQEVWSLRYSDIKKQTKYMPASVVPVSGFVGPAERIPVLVGSSIGEFWMLHADKGTLEETPTLYGYRPEFHGWFSRSSADGKRVAMKRSSYKRYRLQRTDNWKKQDLPYDEDNEIVGVRRNGDLIRRTKTSITLYADDGKKMKKVLFELKRTVENR